ncbi:MAG: ATP-dependent Clp protease ATP-binding subunit [Candidatus Wildermuthbacteria bacterium]|nr:ATP-dependent Clp protease ATP-binding subunit [Candidatus Wildermuthbacteria bacterium]
MAKNAFAYLAQWYLFLVPREIVRGWGNILWFNLEYFSLFFLLKTLFSPWRRQTVSYGKGFNFGRFFDALIGNLISRLLGALVRASLLAMGIMGQIALFFAGPAVFIVWFVFPALLVFALLKGPWGYAFFAAGALWFIYSFSKSYKKVKPLPKAKNLADFIKKTQKDLQFVYARLLLDPKEVITRLSQAKAEILSLAKDAKTPEDVLIQAAKEDPAFQKVLIDLGTNPKDIEQVVSWFKFLKQKLAEQETWWSKQNLRRRGTLGRQWTSGFSPLLDKFSLDVTQQVRKQGFFTLVGHEKELKALERTLAKDQNNNALLVGEPGVGRWAIINELARRSLLGESLPELNYKRLVQLDIPSLLSRVEDAGQREAFLDQIFIEVLHAGNVILIIDEFHNFVDSSHQSPGKIDITGILTKYLARPDFPIIAITTFAGLHQYIERNPSLLNLMDKVEVEELKEEKALEVLEHATLVYEQRYRRFVSFGALKAILAMSQKYIQAVPLPKKALDLLDETMAYLSQTKEKVLLPWHVAKIVEEKTQIPVGEIETAEKEVLLNLEEYIHKKIIDQEEAVREVSGALRRARSEISQRKGPIGGFLFLGPTGVGKTETAKALASIYFGSEEKMVRLDMSEFQNTDDVKRLLGSTEQEGLLTTPIRENPFSLLLLDEIEKAHSNILNLFLQVLDEGHITDGLGRKISFEHSIIIATSNAGSQLIIQAIKENADFAALKDKVRDYLFQQGTFRPEFLNRFDAMVLFKPLTKEHLSQIAGLMLKKLQKNLEGKGIGFVVTEPLKERLAELGYDPVFGARPMKRAIQDNVENILAVSLLKGEIKRGDKVQLDSSTFEVQKV